MLVNFKLKDNIKLALESGTFYVVKFDEGYYSNEQPNYEWSFTDDIIKAKLYKTLYHANERLKYGIRNRHIDGSVFEINLEVKIDLNIIKEIEMFEPIKLIKSKSSFYEDFRKWFF